MKSPPGHSDDWERWLRTDRKRADNAVGRRGDNTIRKHVSIAKTFFNAALRKRLISDNPFTDLKSTGKPNPDRFLFVTRDVIARVLDACPDSQYRLIVA